jgi:hypothetical protein
MSYLMFGTVTPPSQVLLAEAERFRVHLRTEYPGIVDEMLKRGSVLPDDATAFLVVAKPEDDTSDALISPFCTPIDVICDNLGRLQYWLQHIASKPGVQVKLYITEGFDDHFQEIAVAPRDFPEKLCSIIRNQGDWPSLVVNLQTG